MAFARFMATPFGRGLRMVVGGLLVALGIVLITAGTSIVGGIAAIAVGGLFFTVGAVNVCPLALLFGGPVRGTTALASAKD